MLEKLFQNAIFRERFTACQSIIVLPSPSPSDSPSATHTYLSLRERQNVVFARESVRDGIALSATDPASSMKKYNSALELAPDCVEALIARGAAYANKKELKAAAKDFKAALKIDGDHPDARKYLDSVRARSTAAKNARRSLKAGEFVLPHAEDDDPSVPLDLALDALLSTPTTGGESSRKKSKKRRKSSSLHHKSPSTKRSKQIDDES